VKIAELRNRISNLARDQMTVERHTEHLQELVQGLAHLETGWQAEVSQLRRYFRWLCLAMAVITLALAPTCCFLCWQGHQLRRELAQSQAQQWEQLARHFTRTRSSEF
jgi:NhaP-type Na+/H+ or K+/H+ antiporter